MYGSSRNFSLNNPAGPDVENLPLLLRRLADEIERAGIKNDDLLDVTFSNDELTDDGFSWRATVYWSDESSE